MRTGTSVRTETTLSTGAATSEAQAQGPRTTGRSRPLRAPAQAGEARPSTALWPHPRRSRTGTTWACGPASPLGKARILLDGSLHGAFAGREQEFDAPALDLSLREEGLAMSRRAVREHKLAASTSPQPTDEWTAPASCVKTMLWWRYFDLIDAKGTMVVTEHF